MEKIAIIWTYLALWIGTPTVSVQERKKAHCLLIMVYKAQKVVEQVGLVIGTSPMINCPKILKNKSEDKKITLGYEQAVTSSVNFLTIN